MPLSQPQSNIVLQLNDYSHYYCLDEKQKSDLRGGGGARSIVQSCDDQYQIMLSGKV